MGRTGWNVLISKQGLGTGRGLGGGGEGYEWGWMGQMLSGRSRRLLS